MDRGIALIGAASNIGISTYDDGSPRGVDRAPAALRAVGLVQRLGPVDDLGDLSPEPYHQFERLPGKIHHESEVARYCQAIAEGVARARGHGLFPLVLGGDCSVLLGGLLGVRAEGSGADPVGLVYLDGHADFATPEESRTGSAASMALALATGRAEGMPASLHPGGPLVRGVDVALVGRRDEDQPWYGQHALPTAGLLDVPDAMLRPGGYAGVLDRILDRVAAAPGGFWVHLDADVIDSTVMGAVDSPTPGGASPDDLGRLLAALLEHPRAVGMDVTIYDPLLDSDRKCATALIALLAAGFGRVRTA